MPNAMVGDMPRRDLGILTDTVLKIRDHVRTFDELNAFNKGHNPFPSGKPTGKARKVVEEWSELYDHLFGYKLDMSGIYVPAKVAGIERLIVEAEGITTQMAFDKAKELFPCWKCTDESLDKVVYNLYPRRGSIGYWARDRVEADEEYRNVCAEDMLMKKRISGIGLRGRILYEIKFFKETGKHLDINNGTICSSSRYLDGYVPLVLWHSYGGKMYVSRIRPQDAYDSWRVREAVS